MFITTFYGENVKYLQVNYLVCTMLISNFLQNVLSLFFLIIVCIYKNITIFVLVLARHS